MKINIAKCLLELLLERGNVSIPGLGKFELQSQSASFGEGRKSLLPPQKSFVFTEQHNRNDHAFRDYLSEVVNIDDAQAEKFVSKFSADIKAGLNSKKPVELAYLGILRNNEKKGQIEFLANSLTLAKINEILPEVPLPEPKSVGETPKMKVPVPEAAPVKSSVPEKKSPDAIPIQKNPIPQSSTLQKPIQQEVPAKSTYQEPKERGCWPWVLAALLLGALMVFGLKMCYDETEDVYKTIDPTAVVEEEVATNTADEISTTIDVVNEGEEAVEMVNQEVVSGNTGLSSGAIDMPKDCIVIVASMQNQANISRLQNKVRSKNYELYTEVHGAYTRVGVRIDCEALPGPYEDYLSQVSNDFGVNAWSLSPEFPQ